MVNLLPAARHLTTTLTDPAPSLICFLPAGFPAPGSDVDVLTALAKAGADILEIGIPYADAPLDGPAITEANRRSLANGTRVRQVLTTVRQSATMTDKPVLVMSYWEPIRIFGPARFAEELAFSGASGALIPDLTPMNASIWGAAAEAVGLQNLQFMPRATGERELESLVAPASGGLYVPATNGLTGHQGVIDLPGLRSHISRVRDATGLPVVTGIGVSTPEKARLVADYVDGVVIGSPIVRQLLNDWGRAGIASTQAMAQSFAEAMLAPSLV